MPLLRRYIVGDNMICCRHAFALLLPLMAAATCHAAADYYASCSLLPAFAADYAMICHAAIFHDTLRCHAAADATVTRC